jgi:hypothetical protein
MKKITLFMFVLIISLYGFDFAPQYTKIVSITNKNITIDKNITKGMSGFVLQNNMIIARAVCIGKKEAMLLPFKKLQNKALATPKIFPKVGDKVVFGLYNFVGLIIAPNVDAYNKIKAKYPYVTWVNSDIFASMFLGKPTYSTFKNFCQTYNVGVLDFVLDKEYLVDCNSFVVLNSSKLNFKTPKKWTHPLFASYTDWSEPIIGSKVKDWIEYYKKMLIK